MPLDPETADDLQSLLRRTCAELERRLRATARTAGPRSSSRRTQPGLDPDSALELIRAEWLARKALGQHGSSDEWLGAFSPVAGLATAVDRSRRDRAGYDGRRHPDRPAAMKKTRQPFVGTAVLPQRLAGRATRPGSVPGRCPGRRPGWGAPGGNSSARQSSPARKRRSSSAQVRRSRLCKSSAVSGSSGIGTPPEDRSCPHGFPEQASASE